MNPCPNCGAREEHVVVNNTAFCKACGPRVWAADGAAARALSPAVEQEAVVVGASRPVKR